MPGRMEVSDDCTELTNPEHLDLLSHRATWNILLSSTATTTTRGPSGGWGTDCPWLTLWWGSACLVTAWWLSSDRKYDHVIYTLLIFFTQTAHSHSHPVPSYLLVGGLETGKQREKADCHMTIKNKHGDVGSSVKWDRNSFPWHWEQPPTLKVWGTAFQVKKENVQRLWGSKYPSEFQKLSKGQCGLRGSLVPGKVKLGKFARPVFAYSKAQLSQKNSSVPL